MFAVQVRYYGRVQGVGFRATARDTARGFKLGGWVRNEPDGTVLLHAQGPESEVEAFLADLHERMSRFITREERTSVAASDKFSSRFEILR